jgi:hypothetical protein
MTLNTESGLDAEYVPSPVQRVRNQVAAYEASGGVKRAALEGRPVVILTSVGMPHFPEYRRLAAGRDIPIMVLEPIAAPQ